jgi:hypothetical protein
MPINYNSRVSEPSKHMRSPDRVFRLEVIDGKKPVSSIGLVDPRLFKEGDDANRLHAYMDEYSMWQMKYEKGALPGALTGKFTGFKQLKDYAEDYFSKRNIRIAEVED